MLQSKFILQSIYELYFDTESILGGNSQNFLNTNLQVIKFINLKLFYEGIIRRKKDNS